MRDDDADAPGARRSRAAARRRTAPEPVGRLRARRATARSSARARPSRPGRRRTPRSRRSRAAGDRARGRHRLRDARAVRHHGRHAAVHRRADRGRRRPGRGRASTTPTRRSPGAGFARLRDARRRRRRSASAPTAADARPRAVPAPPPHRARRSCVAQDRDQPRRPHRGRRRHVAVDHRSDGRAPTRTSCAPTRRRSSSAPAPRSPTGPRSPCATSTAPPRASPLRVAARRAGPRAGRRARCSTPTLAPDPRRHDRRTPRRDAVDAWRAAGAKVEIVAPGADGRGVDLDAALEVLGRERRAPGAGRGRRRRCSARARRRPRRPARRLRRAAAARRATAARASRSPGPRTHRRRAALRPRRRRAGSAPTSRLDYEPAPEGALMFTGIVEELGRVRASRRNEGGARLEIDADDRARRRRARRVDRGERLLPHRRRARRRLVGGRRGRSRRSPARTSATSRAGDPVNLERPVRLADRLGGHLVQGHVDGDRHGARPRRRSPTARRSSRFDAPAERAALRRAQGLDHRRRHQPHRRRASHDDAVRGRGDPAHARGHDARRRAARRPRQPRSRPRSPSTSNDCCVSPSRKHTHDVRRQSSSAIDAIERGEFVVVVDDEDRENEGDLIIAAEKMTPEKMAFMIRHTSGVICLPMEGERLDELQLPLMVSGATTPRASAPRSPSRSTPSDGTTTGISAADRGTTVRTLIDPRRPSRRPRPARPHLPAALPRGRRAQAGRPHRGRGRPRPARRRLSRRACSPRS